MFSKETYMARRAKLKQTIGSGLLLFLGNDESGMNYADNTYHFRQDSTFLYFFGLPYAGLSAIIDIDNDKEIIFGDELTIDAIVWMGTQPTLKEKSEAAGIKEVRPFKEIETYLKNAQQKGQPIHYLPTYRAEHQIKLFQWLGIVPGAEKPSVPFIMGVVNQRNYKSEEEIAEIEKACIVTADMHLTAMRTVRPGIRESEAVGTVPGFDMEELKAVVREVHRCGGLVLSAIGTSQESSDEDTIKEIAIMNKICGVDIQHIGDAGYGGVAPVENLLAISKAVRGVRHTVSMIARSINR